MPLQEIPPGISPKVETKGQASVSELDDSPSFSVEPSQSYFQGDTSTTPSVMVQDDGSTIPSVTVFSSDSPDKEYSRLRMFAYNIRYGGGSHLNMALRAMAQMRVEIGMFFEMKLTHDMYSRQCCGYSVVATKAKNDSQGGVAFFYRSNANQWTIEGIRSHGPNVISCTLISGIRRWSLLGAYIPPSDTSGETLKYVEEAVRTRCHDPLILLGDLNIDLRCIDDDRSEDIATTLTLLGLSDVANSFPHPKGRWTWSQIRGQRYIRSTTDYILSDCPATFVRWAIKTPRFASDHRGILAELCLASAASHRRYLRRRRHFPVRIQRPMSHEDSVFDELLGEVESPSPKKQRDRSFIASTTWRLIDQRANLSEFLRSHNTTLCASQQSTSLQDFSIQDLTNKFQALSLDSSSSSHVTDHHSKNSQSSFDNIDYSLSSSNKVKCSHQREYHSLGKQIRRALRRDRRRRADRVSRHIESLVGARKFREAYDCLSGWYRDRGGSPPRPLQRDLDSTRSEFQSLYNAKSPVGDPLPTHVDPFPVNDDVPTEAECLQALHHMRRRRAPGASGMRVEDLLRWQTKVPQAWEKVVWLVQRAFDAGAIPQALPREILALIPKSEANKFRGIVLLEVIYKLCTTIIHLRLSESIDFHESIHAFRSGRGTDTAVLEAKLLMQKAVREGRTLYQVFMDLSKAYDMLNRDRLMDILTKYGVGLRTRRLIATIWDQELVILRLRGYYARPFHPSGGIRQGNSDSPTIFDIVIDCVLREWYAIMTAHGYAELISIWYADDGRLAGYNPIAIQFGLDTFVDIFERLGLCFNCTKTKFMVTIGDPISRPESREAYARRFNFTLPTYRERALFKTHCPNCNRLMNQQYLPIHLRDIHHIFVPLTPSSPPPPVVPQTYRISMPYYRLCMPCPVLDCPGFARTRTNMRRHFAYRHPDDTIIILEEGELTRCPNCGLFTRSIGPSHFATKECRKLTSRRCDRARFSQNVSEAATVTFTIRGKPIERVHQYIYLGRLLCSNDSDDAAVLARLSKARATWGRMSRILSRDNSNPRVMARFYVAIVQQILLYGSSSWVVSKRTLRCLDTFHHRCARFMAHRHIRKRADGTWDYPPSETVLHICGLSPISTYIAQRKTTLLNSYARESSALYQQCTSLDLVGSPSRLTWWD